MLCHLADGPQQLPSVGGVSTWMRNAVTELAEEFKTMLWVVCISTKYLDSVLICDNL